MKYQSTVYWLNTERFVMSTEVEALFRYGGLSLSPLPLCCNDLVVPSLVALEPIWPFLEHWSVEGVWSVE